VLAADAADAHDFLVPELSAQLRALLDRHVAVTTGTSNPVDLGAGATSDNMVGVVEALLGSDEVDMLLVALVPTSLAPAEPLVEALAAVRTSYPDKPVVLVGMGGLGRGVPGLTVYHAADHAIEAIGHSIRYAQWRRTPHGDSPVHDAERAEAVRAVARRLVPTDGESSGWVDPAEVSALLLPYGLSTVGVVAEDPQEAADIAVGLGFPVAMKVADPNVVHKIDRGLVRVGLVSAAEVMATARAFADELGPHQVPVLVQPTVDGVEIALGVTRDPSFGPLVMVAAGGVTTGILDDHAFLLPPYSQQDAARAIRSLRMWPLLEGYRGAPRVDIEGLERLLVTLGELALDVPELVEVDFNPVMCTPTGPVLVDVKLRLAEAALVNAGIPRQLRSQA
jgi:acyl-CoA synthetase (NDP forming)